MNRSKRKVRLLPLMLAACLCLTLLPTTALASLAEAAGEAAGSEPPPPVITPASGSVPVTDYAGLKAAVDSAANGDTILIANSIEYPDSRAPITISGKSLTFQAVDPSESVELIHKANGNAYHFEVTGASSLTFEGVTLRGGITNYETKEGVPTGGIRSVSSSASNLTVSGAALLDCNQPLSFQGTLVMTNSLISNCATGITASNSQSKVTLTLRDTTIVDILGSGIYISSNGSDLLLENVQVRNCGTQAGQSFSGAVIQSNLAGYSGTAYVTMRNVTIENNRYGGYTNMKIGVPTGTSRDAIFENVTIGNNAGRGVWLQPNNQDAKHSYSLIMDENTHITRNGECGIYATSNGQTTSVTLQGGHISGNRGSGIFFKPNGALGLLKDIDISGNTNTSVGGGVQIPKATTVDKIQVENCVIWNNSVQQDGGGIYVTPSAAVKAIEIINSRITDNRANRDGGGIYVPAYQMLTVNAASVFSGNTAGTACWLSESDDFSAEGYTSAAALIALHGTHILTPTVSAIPSGFEYLGNFPYAYNNYDINYPGSSSYTVAFDANGGSPEPEAQTVDPGAKLTEPSSPAKDHHSLDGWYTDDNTFANRWDFENNAVFGNFTLYAKWTPVSYTVTFDKNTTDPGSTDANPSAIAVTYPYTTTGTLPTVLPTRGGYAFKGWSTESGSDNAVNFDADTPVDANITVYAVWEAIKPDTYTVNFESNGGTAVAPITNVTGGSTISPPGNPTRAGYTFDGWYKEPGLTSAWNFSSDRVDSHMTLYARWQSEGDEGGGDNEKPGGGDNGGPGGGDNESGTENKPSPKNPGDKLIPQEDGSYVEVDENDVPLGIWKPQDDTWIFEETVPLDDIPRTGGDLIPGSYWLFAIISGLAVFMIRPYRRKANNTGFRLKCK